MAFVQEPSNELLIHSVDEGGKHATTQYFVPNSDTDPGAGGPAAIATAVQGMSNNYVYEAELLIRALNTGTITPTTGPYDRVQDKGLFTWIAADGSRVTFQVPAVLETILKPDGVTIDPTNATVIAALASLKTNMVSSQGAAITGLALAHRRRPFRLKKQ